MVKPLSAKKKGPSNKMKVLMLLLISILVLSYVAVFITPQSNYVTPPSPSSFKPTFWMSFLPADVQGFRFLNITQLLNYPDLFSNEVVLSIAEPSLNISIQNVTYGLDMQMGNNAIVNIIGMKEMEGDRITIAFEGSNLTTVAYNNVNIYRLIISPITMQGGAWICIYNGTLILSEGDSSALDAIKSIISAPVNPFFNNDTLKVGYLMSSLSEGQLLFSYAMSGNNTLKVNWEMRSATNSSGIAVRYLLYFPVSSDVDLKYQDVTTSVLSNAKIIHRSDNVIFGDFSYTASDIRSVLMGL